MEQLLHTDSFVTFTSISGTIGRGTIPRASACGVVARSACLHNVLDCRIAAGLPS
ncbi:unnamed protein product [Callosobruchus maculatus]|uniref:Uncharacterized protein n=1 Tax=Callosobruchus maculatus TaxID=64391 RepID=A0A653DL47_CALMS|nr:unnamed protein product [Callosobruchus maculatus]